MVMVTCLLRRVPVLHAQFAMSVPSIDAVGGPFRAPGTDEAYVVRGSMDEDYFVALLELIARDVASGKRSYDATARPFRQDEWWSAPPADGSNGGVCTQDAEQCQR